MTFYVNMDEPLCLNLALSYTLTCNARCSHCAVWSSPEMKGKLGVEKAVECIRDAHEFGIGIVAWTGGEPTAFLKDIYAVMEHCHQTYGTMFSITTNAFWARSKEKAREVVGHMVDNGLAHLRMSADSYHQKFIPLERVTWAVEAGLERGVVTRVDVVLSRRDPESVKIWNHFKRYPIELGVQSLSPKGRAVEEHDDAYFPSASLQSVRLGSCQQAGQVMVHHDGHVSLCCNFDRAVMMSPESLAESPFILGNVHQEPLRAILERNERSPLSRLLHYEGPNCIVKLLEHYYPQLGLEFDSRYANPCVFCDKLMVDPELIPLIKAAGARFEEDFALGGVPVELAAPTSQLVELGGGSW